MALTPSQHNYCLTGTLYHVNYFHNDTEKTNSFYCAEFMSLFKGVSAGIQHTALSALESKGGTRILFLRNMSTSICLCTFILPECVGQDYKKNWSNENNSMFS